MADKYQEIANDLISGNVQHCIVEASAGTGKTYTIENLVVELVKSPSNFIDLSQLMLVTFTEKAAGELRGRILKTLKKAAEDESLDQEQRKKIRKSVDFIDSAQISTFHAFCQKMMSTYAYDANLPFSFDLVNKNSVKAVVEKACRDEWTKGDFGEFVKFGAKVEKIVSLVQDILLAYNEDTTELPVFEPDESYEEYRNLFSEEELYEIAFVPRESSSLYANLMTRLNELLEKLKPYENETVKTGARSSKPVSDLIVYLANWKDKVNGLISQAYQKIFNAFDDTYPEFGGLLDQAENLRQRLKPVSTQSDVKKIKEPIERNFAVEVAQKLYADWKRNKNENKQKTFDDLISCVNHELKKENSLLKETLQKKFKMAIIDEFQDTNAVQWGIFEALFLNDKNHILVVGDPKQSIYSFQGGDLEIYKKAKNQIIGFTSAGQDKGKLYTLEANFRSSENMIKACNALFCGEPEITADEQDGDKADLCLFGDKEQSFVPATVGNKEKNVASINGDKDYKTFWVSSADDERGFADFCVERLAEIFKIDADGKTNMQVKGRNLKFSDVAVLVRKGREYAVIEEKLASAGIPFLRYKDTTLFEGRECAHWEWLLRAIASANESREFQGALRAALLTDFFKPFLAQESQGRFNQVENYSFETMGQDGRKSLLSMIGLWRWYASKKRWITLFESIYKETGIEQYLSGPSDAGHLARIRQVGEYAQECLISGSYTLTGLAQHLRQLNTGKSNEGSTEDDVKTVAKGSDIDAVQLMTMHASKGLEFPVVIMFGGFTGAYKSVSVSLGELSGDKRKIGFGYNSDQIEYSESRRLFYVAYTRAQFLVLTWLKNDGAKEAPASTFVKTALEGEKLKNDFAKTEFDSISDVKSVIAESVKTLSKKVRLTKSDEEANVDKKLENLQLPSKVTWQRAYSSITHHKHISESDLNAALKKQNPLSQREDAPNPSEEEAGCGEDNEFVFLKTKLPRGAHFGNALHKIFELTDFSKVDEEYLSSIELTNVMKNSFGEEHLKFDVEKHGEPLKKVVYNVLHETIADRNGEKFMLADLQQNQTKREMLFQFSDPVAPNVVIKGFIDLLFVRGEGDNRRYYILDWKSDGLEVYNEDRMVLQVESREYSVQKVLYTYYLIQWLKTFPNFPQSEDEIFEKHFGGIYYVFARGAENDEQTILSHSFDEPENQELALEKFDFWDYSSLKAAFDKIMTKRVNIGGSHEK